VRNSREYRFELVQGETAAYEEMVKRTAKPLQRRADRLCAGDWTLAEECVHLTLLKAGSDDHWPTLRGLAPPQQEKWVSTTMARMALDGLRQRDRRRERATGELPEGGLDRTCQPPGDSSRSDDVLDGQRAYREAREALSRTLAGEHEGPYTVLLMDLADYTDEEIAEVMGIKLVTVRSYRSRGRKIMRREHRLLFASWKVPAADRK
jgi:DNA-directed RNA polymerase specialized sigma24 family protein